MRGKDLIDSLIEMALIEKCGNHSAGHSSSRYRFAKLIRDQKSVGKATLRTKYLIENRKSRIHYAKARWVGANMDKKFRADLFKIRPGLQFIEKFKTYLFRMQAEGKNIRSLQSLLKLWLSGEVQICANHGRITNHIARTPSELRAHLLVSGQSAIELDMPNSHPALLGKIFEPTKSSNLDEIEQHRKYVSLIQEGLFYEAFEHCWPQDRWKFVAFAVPKRGLDLKQHESRKCDFLSLPARKGIKLCWQLVINCRPTFHETKMMKEMAECLPYLHKRLNALKRSSKDALGKELRNREALLINELALATQEPCATIYDGWLSNKRGIADITKAIPEITEKHLGFIHRPKLK